MRVFSTAIASGILGLLAIAPMTLPSKAFANEATKVATRIEPFDHKNFVRSTIGKYLDKVPDLASRTEYFYTEVDLNSDGSREIILVVFSPICGVWECSGYILQKSGADYKTIGRFGVQSSGMEIVALQQAKNKGFRDIATQLYNSVTRKSVWRVYQFDGNTYVNTFQDLNSHPNRVILNVKRGSGLKL
jgi:hypothetical protein